MEEIDRFDCEDDEGRTYTVVARQKVITHRPLAGRTRQAGGAIDYVLDDGSEVTPLDREGNSFKILDGDIVILRI